MSFPGCCMPSCGQLWLNDLPQDCNNPACYCPICAVNKGALCGLFQSCWAEAERTDAILYLNVTCAKFNVNGLQIPSESDCGLSTSRTSPGSGAGTTFTTSTTSPFTSQTAIAGGANGTNGTSGGGLGVSRASHGGLSQGQKIGVGVGVGVGVPLLLLLLLLLCCCFGRRRGGKGALVAPFQRKSKAEHYTGPEKVGGGKDYFAGAGFESSGSENSLAGAVLGGKTGGSKQRGSGSALIAGGAGRTGNRDEYNEGRDTEMEEDENGRRIFVGGQTRKKTRRGEDEIVQQGDVEEEDSAQGGLSGGGGAVGRNQKKSRNITGGGFLYGGGDNASDEDGVAGGAYQKDKRGANTTSRQGQGETEAESSHNGLLGIAGGRSKSGGYERGNSSQQIASSDEEGGLVGGFGSTGRNSKKNKVGGSGRNSRQDGDIADTENNQAGGLRSGHRRTKSGKETDQLQDGQGEAEGAINTGNKNTQRSGRSKTPTQAASEDEEEGKLKAAGLLGGGLLGGAAGYIAKKSFGRNGSKKGKEPQQDEAEETTKGSKRGKSGLIGAVRSKSQRGNANSKADGDGLRTTSRQSDYQDDNGENLISKQTQIGETGQNGGEEQQASTGLLGMIRKKSQKGGTQHNRKTSQALPADYTTKSQRDGAEGGQSASQSGRKLEGSKLGGIVKGAQTYGGGFAGRKNKQSDDSRTADNTETGQDSRRSSLSQYYQRARRGVGDYEDGDVAQRRGHGHNYSKTQRRDGSPDTRLSEHEARVRRSAGQSVAPYYDSFFVPHTSRPTSSKRSLAENQNRTFDLSSDPSYLEEISRLQDARERQDEVMQHFTEYEATGPREPWDYEGPNANAHHHYGWIDDGSGNGFRYSYQGGHDHDHDHDHDHSQCSHSLEEVERRLLLIRQSQALNQSVGQTTGSEHISAGGLYQYGDNDGQRGDSSISGGGTTHIIRSNSGQAGQTGTTIIQRDLTDAHGHIASSTTGQPGQVIERIVFEGNSAQNLTAEGYGYQHEASRATPLSFDSELRSIQSGSSLPTMSLQTARSTATNLSLLQPEIGPQSKRSNTELSSSAQRVESALSQGGSVFSTQSSNDADPSGRVSVTHYSSDALGRELRTVTVEKSHTQMEGAHSNASRFSNISDFAATDVSSGGGSQTQRQTGLEQSISSGNEGQSGSTEYNSSKSFGRSQSSGIMSSAGHGQSSASQFGTTSTSQSQSAMSGGSFSTSGFQHFESGGDGMVETVIRRENEDGTKTRTVTRVAMDSSSSEFPDTIEQMRSLVSGQQTLGTAHESSIAKSSTVTTESGPHTGFTETVTTTINEGQGGKKTDNDKELSS